MNKLCCALFFVFIAKLSLSADYFVTPNYKGCTSKCKGTLDDPFDTILWALYSTLSLPNVTLLLLSNSSTPHYIFNRENNTKNSSIYIFSDGYSFKIAGNLTIRPLYCDEQLVLTNSSLLNQCIQRNQKLPVFLKSTNFTLNLQASTRIEGLIFNALEDIKVWNNVDSTELQDCLYRRKQCCSEGFDMSTLYPSKIKCQGRGNIPIPVLKVSQIFRLDASGTSSRSLIFENTDFRNFLNPQLFTIVTVGAPSFNLTFRQNNIERVWFFIGLTFQISSSTTANSSSILFENMNFTNYNVWDIYFTGSKNSEGYLFYSQATFSGRITVRNSVFKNFVSSRRRECPAISSSSYNYPMNNFFKNSFTGATSNLVSTNPWKWYNYDLAEKFGSSLIYIKSLEGPLLINNCTFQDIIGTSGSVLRVNDVTLANSSIAIYNNIFHNNFVYEGFANIRIAKTTNPYFTRLLECPYIEIINSTFTNSSGCPGAYGNVFLVCYWFPDADTSYSYFTEYNGNSTKITEFRTQIRKIQRDEVAPMFVIRNSTFRNNFLALSNSLIMIGSHYTLLEGNTFQDNGGTTGKVGIYIFNELSCHSKRFPNIKLTENIGGGEINYGQSTVVYLDRFIKLYSKNNIYQRNWGPYEGTLSLGSSISMKNWLTYNGLKFEDDYFGEHGQIPSIFLPKLQVDGWSFYTEPIVAIGIDFYRIWTNDKFDANITLQNVRVVDNIANYDFTNFKYNYDNLQGFKNIILEGTTGLIKLLNMQESAEFKVRSYDKNYDYDYYYPVPFKIRYAFSGGEIKNNILQTPSCLFSSFFVDFYILDNLKIMNNQIAEDQNWNENSQDKSFANIEKKLTGLFCSILTGDYRPVTKTAISLQNSVLRNNTATLVNTYESNKNTIYVMNSVISENRCSSSALFQILDAASLVNINNLIINNYNALGNIYLDNPGSLMTMFNTYLQNDGFYSSIFLLKDQVINSIFQESFAKVYWNTVSPSSSFFSKRSIPQSGLYFVNSSQITFWMNDYWQNTPHSGIVTAVGSMVIFKNCEIKDHYISGISILGSYILSSLQTFNTKLVNSQIIAKNQEMIGVNSGVIILVEADAVMSNLEIINGTAQNGALLIVGNCATVSMNDINIENFYQVDRDKTPLLHFTLSDIEITSLRCSNITSIFQLFQSSINLKAGIFENIRAFNNILYLFNVDKTDLRVQNVSYIGNGEFGEFPLFTGKSSNFELLELRISNASNQIQTIIDLNDDGSLFVSNSIFEFPPDQIGTTIFDLSSLKNVTISQSIFNFPGRVIRANNLYADFYFLGNTILTISHIKSILLINTKSCYILDNHLLGHKTLSIIEQRLLTDQEVVLSESQLKIVDNTGQILLEGNVFVSLLGLNGIVEINSNTFPYKVDFDRNIFIDNTASQGGAIYLEASKLSSIKAPSNTNIVSSMFVMNRAISYGLTQGIGGAIYLATQDVAVQNTQVIESAFIKNSAEVDGGAIYFDHSLVNISKTSTFQDNKALRVNHIASKPSYFIYFDSTVDLSHTYIPSSDETFNTNTIKNFYKWDRLASGLETNQTFVFALLDVFGQLVNDDSSVLTFKAQDNKRDFSSLNQIKLQAQDGFYYMKNPKFNYQVSSIINMTFSSTALNRSKQVVPPITIEISFRSCGIGEFVSQNGDYVICEKCPSGFWQLDQTTNALSCSECDTDKMICLGGDKVGPKPGYWRMNETAELVLQCPRVTSCKGNFLTNQEITQNNNILLSPMGECEEGYEGHLCSKCTPGWAKSSSSPSAECLPCAMNVGSFFLLAFLICLKVGLIVFSVKGTMQLAENYGQDKGQVKNDAVLLRIMLNYLQLVALVAKIPVTWPNVLNELFTTTSEVSSVSEQAFSVECFILAVAESMGIKHAFFKVFFTATTPFFFAILGFLFWVIYFKVTKKPILSNRDFTNKSVTTIIIICYQNQAAAIQSGLSIFRCTNLYRIRQPTYFLEIDYDIECWTQDHLFWMLTLGIPIIFVWIIAFPGILAFILAKNKKKLHVQKVSQKYSFFYGGYRTPKFYWEFVILFRKILIMIAIIIAGLHSVRLQLYVGILAIILSLILHEMHRPYSDMVLNNLERASLFSAGIVNFTGLYFHIIPSQPVLDIIIIIFGLLGDLYFLFLFAGIFLRVKALNLLQNEKIRKILNKISQKCQCLNRIPFMKKALDWLNTSLNPPQEVKKIAEIHSFKNQLLDTPLSMSVIKFEGLSPEISGIATQERMLSPTAANFPLKLQYRLGSLKHKKEDFSIEFSVRSQDNLDPIEQQGYDTPHEKTGNSINSIIKSRKFEFSNKQQEGTENHNSKNRLVSTPHSMSALKFEALSHDFSEVGTQEKIITPSAGSFSQKFQRRFENSKRKKEDFSLEFSAKSHDSLEPSEYDTPPEKTDNGINTIVKSRKHEFLNKQKGGMKSQSSKNQLLSNPLSTLKLEGLSHDFSEIATQEKVGSPTAVNFPQRLQRRFGSLNCKKAELSIDYSLKSQENLDHGEQQEYDTPSEKTDIGINVTTNSRKFEFLNKQQGDINKKTQEFGSDNQQEFSAEENYLQEK